MNILKAPGIIIISIVVVALVAVFVFFFLFQPIYPSSIAIENITVTNEKITIKGADVMDSVGLAYRWHTVKYENENLYITIIGGLHFEVIFPFLNYRYPTDFTISIPNKYGTIKRVYLHADYPAENRLIWPK